MHHIIVTLLEGLVSKSNLAILLLVAITLYNTKSIEELAEKQDRLNDVVATEYAYDVLAFGLRNTGTDEEVVDVVKKWKSQEKSARVGAMRTVCENAPYRLDVIMSSSARIKVCRLVG